MMIFWSNLRRVAHIMSVLVSHGLAHAMGERLTRWPWLARRLPSGTLSGPERLRVVIEDLGGTFIKFGQMLALQPDILSLEYCNALFNLLDRVAPFEYQHIEKTFIEDLGRAPSQIFDSFDPQPLATASIGQVHVAMLDGRKLAVKVQRPTVQTDFAGDIRLMTAGIRLIKTLHLKPFHWMIEPMSEFVAWTREELDYRYEARYMDQLRRNAHDNECERVPAVVWEHTTRRLLVAEFLEGVTVLDHLRALETGDQLMAQRLTTLGFEPNRFARNIIDNFLGDAFKYGLFHADLHPANLMILSGNVVGYIDFGITGVLSHYSRQNLVAMTLAYTRADVDGMCESFFKVTSMDADSDPQAFREGLKRLSDEWYERQGKERRLRKNFTLVMLDMLRLSRKTGIWPERDVIKYIRSAIAIDGLITRFAPAFNVGRYLEMVCDHYLTWQARRALFSYDQLVNWSSASGHLVRDGSFRAAHVLHRVASGQWPARAELGGAPEETDATRRLQAVQLAAVVFTVSLLITLTQEPARFGVNLFTAEALLVVAAVLFLLRTIRRLA
jgi:ubiquinone biosynthesis protein